MFSSLTRRVTFAAAHRYRRDDWSEERNAAVFGACARASYHGHGYACRVTVRGPVDPETGFCVDLGLLDRVLDEEVRQPFDHRNLNVDVPEFAAGVMPTGENLAALIARRVQRRLDDAGGPAAARVTRVEVAEDETISATFEPERDGAAP